MTAPFRIVPGDLSSKAILYVPHASRLIPDDVRAGIVLDDASLERELNAMTDAFTDVIAEQAAASAHVRPWLFVNQLSRLIIDPERFPDDREEMLSVGMGAVYSRTSNGEVLRNLPVEGTSGLFDRYFAPYAGALATLVDRRLAATGGLTIVDVHSYPLEPLPYELHRDAPRPEVCLGTDELHTPPSLIDAARQAFASSKGDFGLDAPFSGCYVPLKHYGTSRAVRALMLELRRDTYMTDAFAPIDSAVSRLAASAASLINSIDRELG